MPFGAKCRNTSNPAQILEYTVAARFRGIQELSLCCKQIIEPEVARLSGTGLQGLWNTAACCVWDLASFLTTSSSDYPLLRGIAPPLVTTYSSWELCFNFLSANQPSSSLSKFPEKIDSASHVQPKLNEKILEVLGGSVFRLSFLIRPNPLMEPVMFQDLRQQNHRRHCSYVNMFMLQRTGSDRRSCSTYPTHNSMLHKPCCWRTAWSGEQQYESIDSQFLFSLVSGFLFFLLSHEFKNAFHHTMQFMNKLIVLHGWELSKNVACYRHLYLLINIYLLSQPEKWKLVGCSVYLNSVWHISEFLGCVISELLYFLFLDMSLFKSYTLKIPYFYLFPSYRGSRIVLWISLFIYLPNYV